MRLQKNQEVELTIDDLGKDGEGIGHLDGYALFIKDTLPGERVRAKITKTKKGYGFARLTEILTPSAERTLPACSVARQCGGCTLQHLSYQAQLAYKEKKVKDCLERIGSVDFDRVEFLPILGMEDDKQGSDVCLALAEPSDAPTSKDMWHYRNKAQFPVRALHVEKGIKPVTGFFAGRTHSIIPVTDCQIQHPFMRVILETLQNFMCQENIPAYDEENHTGLIRHIFIRVGFATGETMVCLVVNEKAEKFKQRFGKAVCEAFSNLCYMGEEGQKFHVQSLLLNENRERTNVILGKHFLLLCGTEYIEDKIGDIRYRISAPSFYQVNPSQTVKLYDTALAFADLQGGETVWDLYCGIGTISLYLASAVGGTGHVYGVEIVECAVEDARRNAKLNGIKNTEFFCGAAEDIVGASELSEKVGEAAIHPDVVVIDPPRKGCDATLLDTIRKMSPRRIVYVSCDPATLARDVKLLGEEREGDKGYEVKKVRACDMFPQGGHVECVCLLTRNK